MEGTVDRRELIRAVDSFVKALPEGRRRIFVRRYWYADPIAEIAKDCGMTQGAVSKTLERTRKRLKEYLTERGFEI